MNLNYSMLSRVIGCCVTYCLETTIKVLSFDTDHLPACNSLGHLLGTCAGGVGCWFSL